MSVAVPRPEPTGPLRTPGIPGWWARLALPDGSAVDLAGARIVIAAHALWILLSRDLAAASGLPPELWLRVHESARWRYLLFPGVPSLKHLLQVMAAIALVAAIAGFRTRAACLVASLLLYHLAPLETLIWTPSPYERGFEVSVLALVVLGVSRSGDAWSVDAKLARRAGDAREPAPAWEYGWPLRLVQVFVAQIYFFAGYSKLFRAGFDWISADNLRRWLLLFSQQDQVAVFREPGLFIARHPSLCLAAALGAVVIDLGFPAAVFLPRLRRWLVPAALAFHAGILMTMNIVFLNAPQLGVFVNWRWIAESCSSALEHHLHLPRPIRQSDQSPVQRHLVIGSADGAV